jgi:hypothetical protein
MQLLGHSPMRTTMDIYSCVMPALAREAAHRMSALLLPGGSQSNCTHNCNQKRVRTRASARKPWSDGWS